MSEMNHAWLVDMITALLTASIVAIFMIVAGGPGWAVIGIWWIIYLTHQSRAQQKVLLTKMLAKGKE